MYQKFYNLTRAPFHITPDPKFLHLSDSHKQALAAIIYGIEKKKGFVAITGGVGVGKTTIVRAYLEKAAGKDLKFVYVFHANLTFKDLLKTIYRDLELELATNDLLEMVNGLHLALIEFYRKGKTVVVIVDEAQNVPLETLENLRMLSNLETPTEKLIQVVLVGQTELEDLLERHELRQLKQRIAIRAHIEPLTPQDSYAYISHRLYVAGLMNATIFTKGALDIIVKEANGVPRTINILCDNALITGYGSQKNPITANIAREVVNDFQKKKKLPPSTNQRWRFAVPAAVVALFLVLLLLFTYRNFFGSAFQWLGGQPTTNSEPARAPANTLESQPQKKPTKAPPAVSPALVVPQPSSESSTSPPPSSATPGRKYTVLVVKHGQTLSELVRNVYGATAKEVLDGSAIELVRQANPGITNTDLILAGSTIRFPELPSRQ
jgi:general secretion pathway protein A